MMEWVNQFSVQQILLAIVIATVLGPFAIALGGLVIGALFICLKTIYRLIRGLCDEQYRLKVMQDAYRRKCSK